MYEEFLKQIEDFIFVEDLPEKADIIFVPGNGYPQMAEKRPNCTGKDWRRRFCQVVDTALLWENLPGCWIKRNVMEEHTGRNGNFSGMFL